MDDRLSKAMQHANFAVAFQQARENLLLRLSDDIVYAENGGMFSATEARLSYLAIEGISSIILDDTNRPVLIADLKSFREKLIQKRSEALNRYLANFTLLAKSRSVSQIANIA